MRMCSKLGEERVGSFSLLAVVHRLVCHRAVYSPLVFFVLSWLSSLHPSVERW